MFDILLNNFGCSFSVFIIAAFSLSIGSFLSALSWRNIEKKSILEKDSICPKCKKKLKWKDLIPLLSYISQLGNCRYCKEKVSFRYPLIEIITLFAISLVVMKIQDPILSFLMVIITTILILLSIIDFETGLLPTKIIYILVPIAIIYKFFENGEILTAIISSVFGLLFGYVLYYGSLKLKKRECIGFGDVRFFVVISILLPFEYWGVFFILSGVFGVFTALMWRVLRKGEAFPFGPSLALSLYVCLLFPDIINII